MIITRSPAADFARRGRYDLPSYYREKNMVQGSNCRSDRQYVYITVHDTFDSESSSNIRNGAREYTPEVQHPIVREALRRVGIENPHIEIASMADIRLARDLDLPAVYDSIVEGVARLP